MGDRFFPATAMGGRLYSDGLKGPYCDESVVDMLVDRVVHRKAVTADEVQAILRESAEGLPAIRVWVAAGLEEAVRQLQRRAT